MSIVVTKNSETGAVTVDEAPPTAYIAAEVIANHDPDVITFRGGVMVIAGQVAYVPRAFDKNGNLICDRVEVP